MDIEMEAPIDDLEALFPEEEEDLVALAEPTANCTNEGQGCTS